MKKILYLFITILVAATVLINLNKVQASSATTRTYTLDYKGNMVSTQDAYLPETTFTEFSLSSAKEMFSYNGIMYVTDNGSTKEKPVIKLVDENTGELVKEISSFDLNGVMTEFKSLNGIYIRDFTHNVYGDNQSLIYVCDTTASCVYIFDLDFKIVKVITSPNSVLFKAKGKKFQPIKIAVDDGANMYILASGINEGILQLSINGEFLGYFASNKVQLSLTERFQEALYTDEQKEKLPPKNPPVFSNIYCDEKGMIFSTTQSNTPYTYLQKHNTAGQNQLTKYPSIADGRLVDVTTDKNGIIYALSKTGKIYVYTQTGEFIYSFGGGGSIDSPDISGVFNDPQSICVSDDLKIWVIDGEKGIIQTFNPTEYATTIYDALNAYLASDYEASIALWNKVLELNQMSNLAHNNIGLNYLYSEQYQQAMYHLKISNNKTAYSSAYWEVRNMWLQHNLTWIIATILVLLVLYQVVKRLNKKYHFLDGAASFKSKIANIGIIRELLDVFRIARHPENGFYDLRIKKKGSIRGSWILLLILFIVYLIYITSKGFIYQYTEVADIDFVNTIIGFFAIVFSFIICNYLVVSIMDGMGTLKDIFKLVMYSIAPMLIGMLLVVVLSHFMTESESFLLSVVLYVSIGWSVILVCIGMQEMQGYNFRQFVASILLTIVLMIIFIIVLLIIFVLSQELIDFIQLIIKEVIRNVTA